MTKTSQAKSSERRGREYETDVTKLLQAGGFGDAARLATAGKDDRGDIGGITGGVIECKHGASKGYSKLWDDADDKRDRIGADFAMVWIKRDGKADARDSHVLIDGRTAIEFLQYRAQFQAKQKRGIFISHN